MMSATQTLKEEDNDARVTNFDASRFSCKRILLMDVLPVGILVITSICYSLLGAAIFQKLEEDEPDT